MKEKMSRLLLVLVREGGSLFAHLTSGGHVTVLAVPSAVNIRVNPIARFEVDGVLEMVSVVMFALRETLNTCAEERSSVRVLVLMLGLLVVSL
jgi:hypothetical protein